MGQVPEDVFKTYDLKGSTLGRISHNANSPLKVLKDLNFLDNKDDRLHIKESDRQQIVKNIEKDKNFLKTHSLMDYSLLLYIMKKHDYEEDNTPLR